MRTVVVLAEAAADIEQGGIFMTRKNPASAIIALIRWWRTSPASRSITEFIYAVAGFFGCWRTGFPSGFTIVKRNQKRRSLPCSICVVTRTGFARNFPGAIDCRPRR